MNPGESIVVPKSLFFSFIRILAGFYKLNQYWQVNPFLKLQINTYLVRGEKILKLLRYILKKKLKKEEASRTVITLISHKLLLALLKGSLQVYLLYGLRTLNVFLEFLLTPLAFPLNYSAKDALLTAQRSPHVF